MALRNAALILNPWHFLDSGLEKFFGRSHYNMLEGYLVKMVKASSKREYEDNLNAVYTLIYSQNLRDCDHERKVTQFASRWETYSAYLLPKFLTTVGYEAVPSQNKTILVHFAT